MCEFVEYFGGILEPEFGIGVSKGRAIFGHHQHLFNCPWLDYIMSQSIQKGQPPCNEHVVCEDEVFIRKVTEV